MLSSNDIRIMVEIQAAMFWISFPLYLIAMYGIKKILLSLFANTRMEIWIYVLEKSYLFSLLVTNIIAPAIRYTIFHLFLQITTPYIKNISIFVFVNSLVIVSFEWSIHQCTPEPDFVPTGYYIQLYAMTMVYELYDAICLCDGLFLFLILIIPQFRYCTKDPKYNIWKQHLHLFNVCGAVCKTCYHIMLVILATSISIVFIVSLFRFANHGFFSLSGGASFLPVYTIILKFMENDLMNWKMSLEMVVQRW